MLFLRCKTVVFTGVHACEKQGHAGMSQRQNDDNYVKLLTCNRLHVKYLTKPVALLQNGSIIFTGNAKGFTTPGIQKKKEEENSCQRRSC